MKPFPALSSYIDEAFLSNTFSVFAYCTDAIAARGKGRGGGDGGGGGRGGLMVSHGTAHLGMIDGWDKTNINIIFVLTQAAIAARGGGG
jgi:hypothetical protein